MLKKISNYHMCLQVKKVYNKLLIEWNLHIIIKLLHLLWISIKFNNRILIIKNNKNNYQIINLKNNNLYKNLMKKITKIKKISFRTLLNLPKVCL